MKKTFLALYLLCFCFLSMAQQQKIIPVVFHIFHTQETGKFTNSQIFSILSHVNKDFRLQRSDTSQIAAAFKSRAADTEINFKLATIDPQGNCTNGIERHLTDQVNTDPIEWKEIIEPYVWDNSKYLNIFIHPRNDVITWALTGNPYSNATLHTANLSSNITDASFYTLEIARWLGLNTLYSLDCTDRDSVADTPVHSYDLNCNDTVKNVCGELQNTDNFMHFGFCARRMFTTGQKERMQFFLENHPARSQWNSENLIAVGADYIEFPETELCRAEFSALFPEGQCAGNSILFTNESINTTTAWKWSFPGGEPSSSTEKNPSVIYTDPGSFDVSLTVYNGPDSLSLTKKAYIKTSDPAVLAYPYIQDFDLITPDLSPEFTVIDFGGNTRWELCSIAGLEDSYSVYIKNSLNLVSGEIDEITSGTFDLSNHDKHELSFFYAYAPKSPNSNDELELWTSVNCGMSWQKKRNYKGSLLATAPATNNNFIPTEEQWKSSRITFQNIQKDGFKFKFTWKSGSGNNIYIDKINLRNNPDDIASNDTSPPFRIYPNPAESKSAFSVSVSGITRCKIYLSDYAGRYITGLYDGDINGRQELLIVNPGLAPGLYLVNLVSDEATSTQKLIIY